MMVCKVKVRIEVRSDLGNKGGKEGRSSEEEKGRKKHTQLTAVGSS